MKYTRTWTRIPGPDPKYKEPNFFWVLTGIWNVDPNRPGPDKTRPGTDPNFWKYPYGSKIFGPERPGPETTRPGPDPRTRMPRPSTTCYFNVFFNERYFRNFIFIFLKSIRVFCNLSLWPPAIISTIFFSFCFHFSCLLYLQVCRNFV